MKQKAKNARKEPSERTRNLRHGQPDSKTKIIGNNESTDGKSRVNAQIAALAQRSSGVSKMTKQKTMSSKQRRRRDQMLEKAFAFNDKIEKKSTEYLRSQESIKERAKDWDQVNESAISALIKDDERIAELSRSRV